jgi:hypothetical protein
MGPLFNSSGSIPYKLTVAMEPVPVAVPPANAVIVTIVVVAQAIGQKWKAEAETEVEVVIVMEAMPAPVETTLMPLTMAPSLLAPFPIAHLLSNQKIVKCGGHDA